MQAACPPESDEELRSFIDHTSLGLRWVDPDGRILWANRAELELVGCQEREYIGHHVAEFFVDPGAAAEILVRLARREGVSGFEARLRARDGAVRNVLIDGRGLFRDGRLVHSRCVTRDITWLLEKEEAARHRAEETSHLQDDFLALLSHELRAPLGTVLLWLGLLKQGDSDADETRRAVEIMHRCARTLEQIVEDLVHASRIAAGGLTLNPERIDFVGVVQEAVDAALGDAAVAGLQVTWSAKTDPIWVLGDAGRLRQAVSNLLSNAVKFTPAGGLVDVCLDVTDMGARLRVIDTGEGMSSGFLPFAFGRFRQQDSTSTRAHHGLGLGLYVVRHVVEHHGGRVLAESPGPARGSTFTVLLPLAREASAGPRRLAAPLADAAFLRPGLKVLLVDDEDDVREALTLLLRHHGAVVVGAASAREALAVVQGLKPDVILSDIAMPDEDGLSFIRSVRALPPARGGRT
ncbi:MAG TPA: ATP-binding protein, partial [Vicinamibacteria bacterium]|nr:ATP-binding protein [Vicinamibacteria bacterium]